MGGERGNGMRWSRRILADPIKPIPFKSSEMWLNQCATCGTNNPAFAPLRPELCAGCGQQLVVASMSDAGRQFTDSYDASVARRTAQAKAAAYRCAQYRVRAQRAAEESESIERRKQRRIADDERRQHRRG